MKSLLITLLLFTIHYSLFTAPARAQVSCNQTPDYANGLVPYLFDTSQENISDRDCSLAPYHNPTSTLSKEYQQNAVVACLENQSLSVSYNASEVEKAEQLGDLFDRAEARGGFVTTDPIDLANFSANAAVLTQNLNTDNLLPPNQNALTNYYGNYNPATFEATCEALSVNGQSLTPAECAQKFPNFCLLPGNRVNLFCYNSDRLLTTQKEQFQKSQAEAQKIVSCVAGTAPDNTKCYNKYKLSETGPYNQEVIENTLPDTYEQYRNLPSQQKTQIAAATQASKALIPLYIVVSRHKNTQSFLDYFTLEANQSVVYEVPVAGLVGASEFAPDRFCRSTSLENCQKKLTAVKNTVRELSQGSGTDIPPAQNPQASYVVDIVKTKSCINTDAAETQFTGGLTPTPPAPTPWFFNLLNILVDRILTRQPLYTYSIWVVQPYESFLLGQVSKEYAANFFPLAVANAFKDVAVPYALSDTPAQAETTIGQYQETITDPDTGAQTTVTKDVKAKFSSLANLVANILGEAFTYTETLNAGQNLRSLDDPEHFSSMCQYPELLARDPTLAEKLGVSGRDLSAYQAACPTDPFALARQLIQTYGNLNQTEAMCDIARDHNVPCEFLAAIWEIETGSNPGSPGPDCCNSVGACGPMQILGGRVEPLSAGQNLNVCSLPDAWVLAARLLSVDKCVAETNLGQAGNRVRCNTWEWSEEISADYPVGPTEYEILAYYYGIQNGCFPDACTQCRWGAGVDYCDFAKHLIETGQRLPDVQQEPYCSECRESLNP